jgi:hypothetical protein
MSKLYAKALKTIDKAEKDVRGLISEAALSGSYDEIPALQNVGERLVSLIEELGGEGDSSDEGEAADDDVDGSLGGCIEESPPDKFIEPVAEVVEEPVAEVVEEPIAEVVEEPIAEVVEEPVAEVVEEPVAEVVEEPVAEVVEEPVAEVVEKPSFSQPISKPKKQEIGRRPTSPQRPVQKKLQPTSDLISPDEVPSVRENVAKKPVRPNRPAQKRPQASSDLISPDDVPSVRDEVTAKQSAQPQRPVQKKLQPTSDLIPPGEVPSVKEDAPQQEATQPKRRVKRKQTVQSPPVPKNTQSAPKLIFSDKSPASAEDTPQKKRPTSPKRPARPKRPAPNKGAAPERTPVREGKPSSGNKPSRPRVVADVADQQKPIDKKMSGKKLSVRPAEADPNMEAARQEMASSEETKNFLDTARRIYGA